MRYDDTTNAFKLYRREVIDGVSPLLSHHFNLTVELPLKAMVRGYSHVVVPNSWTNRAPGRLQVQDQGDGLALRLHRALLPAREMALARRLPPPGRAAAHP